MVKPEAASRGVSRGEPYGITRRGFVCGSLAAVASLTLGGHLRGPQGPTPTERDIITGIKSQWRDLAVFAGGVVLGSDVELSHSPDFSRGSRVERLDAGEALGARRPVLVAQSATLNGYNSTRIDPGIVGFWLPDLLDDPVFARYDPRDPFWPVYIGRETGYTQGFEQLIGEAVRSEPDNGGPRHFIVRGPAYEGRESRTRYKDIGQSATVGLTDSSQFARRLQSSFGSFEIRDWLEYQREHAPTIDSVDQGRFDGATEVSDGLVDRVSRGLESNWRNLNVFAGVVGINRTTQVFSDLRLTEGSEVEWPEEHPHAVVVRPLFVVGSSRLNIESEDRGQIEEGVKRTTIGFWLPGTRKFVYMDTAANKGNIIPVTRGVHSGQVKSDGILGYDITLDGREIEEGVSYPYFNDESERVLVGHSLGFSNGAEALDAMHTFYTDKQSQPLTLGN